MESSKIVEKKDKSDMENYAARNDCSSPSFIFTRSSNMQQHDSCVRVNEWYQLRCRTVVRAKSNYSLHFESCVTLTGFSIPGVLVFSFYRHRHSQIRATFGALTVPKIPDVYGEKSA